MNINSVRNFLTRCQNAYTRGRKLKLILNIKVKYT